MKTPADQIALPLDWPQVQDDSRFILSEANRSAFDHFRNWSLWPVKATMLTGPRRSGRSLLARAFVARVKGRLFDAAERHDEAGLFHAWNAAQECGPPIGLVGGGVPPAGQRTAMKRALVWLQLIVGWLPIWMLYATMIAAAHPLVTFENAALISLRAIACAAVLGVGVYRLTERLPWPYPIQLRFVAAHLVAASLFAVAWVLLTSLVETLLHTDFHVAGLIRGLSIDRPYSDWSSKIGLSFPSPSAFPA